MVFLKNEAVVIDESDDVYFIMNNHQFKIDNLCQQQICKLAYSSGIASYHILAMTKKGCLYSWGRNTFKQVKFAIAIITIFPIIIDPFAFGAKCLTFSFSYVIAAITKRNLLRSIKIE